MSYTLMKNRLLTPEEVLVLNSLYRIPPAHAHYFELWTSVTNGHAHSIQTFTFPVNGNSTDGHAHTFAGITSLAEGHHHHFEGVTGPAIPLEDGSHYHEIDWKTYDKPFTHKGNAHIPLQNDRHFHIIKVRTTTGLGYEPRFYYLNRR